jgi:undecaprenyl-diphosphatase
MAIRRTIGKNTIVFIFSLIFLALFFITIVLLNAGLFQKTDELVNSYFSTPSSVFFTNFSLIIGFIFDPLNIIVILLIVFLFLFFGKFKKDSLFLLVVSLFGGILIFGLKELFQRVRPENLYESGFGFPSGHAAISIILFCSLIYFSFKYLNDNYGYLISGISIVFILFILFSRFYLGVHWFSDIIGGIFLGTFVFLSVVSFFGSSKVK